MSGDFVELKRLRAALMDAHSWILHYQEDAGHKNPGVLRWDRANECDDELPLGERVNGEPQCGCMDCIVARFEQAQGSEAST